MIGRRGATFRKGVGGSWSGRWKHRIWRYVPRISRELIEDYLSIDWLLLLLLNFNLDLNSNSNLKMSLTATVIEHFSGQWLGDGEAKELLVSISSSSLPSPPPCLQSRKVRQGR